MAASFPPIFCSSNAINRHKGRRTKPAQDTADRKIAKPSNIGAIRLTFKRARSRSLDPTIARILHHAESGDMDVALRLFEEANNPMETFVWNVIIRGYADRGLYEEAIEFYRRMESAGVPMDSFTFPFVLKSCAGLSSFVEGSKTHCKLIKIGLDVDIFICNALIAMYAKVGCVDSAEKVFYEMPVRDAVSWNSMIGGYAANGDERKSMLCFRNMQAAGVEVDRFSIIGVLAACALEKTQRHGKEIHCYVIRCWFELDIMVETSLIDMYCKCGGMDFAEHIISRMSRRNTVSWNALIGGYVQNNRPDDAFDCLMKMQEVDRICPDSITLVNLLPACVQLRGLSQGKSIHGKAIRSEFLPFSVLETVLIDMYANCGDLQSAEVLFQQMTEKNLVQWNVMITAYVQHGRNLEALELFNDLQRVPLTPDALSIASIIPAYAELALLRSCRQIHGYVMKTGHSSNTFVLNSLIYTYAKCGDLHTARKIFDGMRSRDVVTWNVIILAYGIHGFGRTALELFSKMLEGGTKPNQTTFVSVLSSCSITGMVDEGWQYFNAMQQDYSIEPQIEHYGCMVDLLGRTGDLSQAESFIMTMPLTPTARIWGSLLVACRKNGNIELAELAVERILALENDNTGCYILLSNMYADAGIWEDVERVRSLMKKEGLQRTISCSTVELNSETCSFHNGDRSHDKSNMIQRVLDILSMKIGEIDHIPSTKFKPQDVVRRKESMPSAHSVRLAISFGLICTTPGAPILIRKNVRICDDCHGATKLISKVTRREIVVGDSKIYHHFDNGQCSCGDYW